jgi:hypothetical protein
MPGSPVDAQAPTSRLTLVHGQPAGESHRPDVRNAAASGGGLPRRVRQSVRAEADAAVGGRARRPEPASQRPLSSDRDAWPDETADFAAGIAEAQAPTTAQPRGHL